MCSDEDCDFKSSDENVLIAQSCIFTVNQQMTQSDIIHALMNGVRKVNLDTRFGTQDENNSLVQLLSQAIKTFENKSKFNLVVTKVCTIRGRVPRTGRLRNGKQESLWPCEIIVLTSDKRYEFCSTSEVCYVSSFARLIEKLKCDMTITIGRNILKVVKIALGKFVTCCVINGNILESYDEVKVEMPLEDKETAATEEETEDCRFAVENEFDFIVVPSVNCPEQYHALHKVTKDSEIKIIAEIDKNMHTELIDQIIEHFYGVTLSVSSTSTVRYIKNKTRELHKLLISSFSEESCFKGKSCICDSIDSLFLTSSKVNEAIARLVICRNNNEKYQKAVHVSKETHESGDKLKTCKGNSLKEIEDIASSHLKKQLIVMTTCPTIAKRLQMWKNTTTMVYVDCENKSKDDQMREVQKIVLMFMNDMKLLEL